MKVAFFAELNTQQLDYLRNLAQENNIEVTFVVGSESQPQTKTPITGEMLERVSRLTDKTVIEWAAWAFDNYITTVEDAIEYPDIPISIKCIFEEYI